MSKAKQYNFYVNPEEEKELKEFLDSFPRMVRSNYIKTAIQFFKQNGGSPLSIPSFQENTQGNLKTSNNDNILSFKNRDFELDDDDL